MSTTITISLSDALLMPKKLVSVSVRACPQMSVNVRIAARPLTCYTIISASSWIIPLASHRTASVP